MNRWIPYNPNPLNRRVGDCAVRACCKASGRTWDEVFDSLAEIAFEMKDVISANAVWGEYLKRCGFVRRDVECYAPERCDVIDFCRNHPHGIYVLGMDGHVVAVEDGFYFDSWDSGEKHPLNYWART